jgi:hypothetical protein
MNPLNILNHLLNHSDPIVAVVGFWLTLVTLILGTSIIGIGLVSCAIRIKDRIIKV